jgi:8-oxo-dGTP diphosphatase
MIIPEDQKKNLSRGVDYIGVNCVFFCHDGKGNVLLHKRSQKCRDERGTWDVGAGSMEFGETFEETVRREVKEEYGVDPIKIEYIATKNILREHEGKKTHWIKNLHWVEVDPDKVTNGDPEKIDEIGWFTLDNPPHPLHSQYDDELATLKEYFRKKS